MSYRQQTRGNKMDKQLEKQLEIIVNSNDVTDIPFKSIEELTYEEKLEEWIAEAKRRNRK